MDARKAPALQQALPTCNVEELRRKGDLIDTEFRNALGQLADLHRRQDALAGIRKGA